MVMGMISGAIIGIASMALGYHAGYTEREYVDSIQYNPEEIKPAEEQFKTSKGLYNYKKYIGE